ncbi:MAG TPA: hypothetical protein VKB91_00520 [Gemmatimonadaceae bacterium]|nr:hypothetical protein [Gemmatimonadaceae bacterium]
MTPPVPPAPRPGLPDPKTVLTTLILQPIVPKTIGGAPPKGTPKQAYTILRTNQVDEYEKPPASDAAVLAAPKTMKAAGDKFTGSDRKAAKISVSKKKVVKVNDLKDLIGSLASESAMTAQHISKDKTSGRVPDEDRNVRVTAWLYAASREKDNDFHLIIGRDPSSAKAMYMTMEISGLPAKTASSFKAIKKVRDAYSTFFSGNLPGTGYDFPDPPVKLEIGGSLFFDVTHLKGGRPGPKDLRPDIPTIWEIHPVTFLKFEP